MKRFYIVLGLVTTLLAGVIVRCPAQVEGGHPFHSTVREVRPAAEVTVQIPPLDVYATWWHDTEECMDLHGDVTRWSWYSVQEDAFTVDGLDGGFFLAYTFGPFDPVAKPSYWWRIYVVNSHLRDAITIRHEMVHALADMNGIASLHNTPTGDSLFAVFANRSFCHP